MPARPRRALQALAILAVASTLPVAAASAAASAATLGAPTVVSTPYAWTVGNGLAKTSGYLQAAFASDCPPPRLVCASDGGPFMGVFWRRDSLTTPGPWSEPMRISTVGRHAARPAIAAGGTNVYVAWVTQASYLHYQPAARRVVWIRASNDEGDTWRTPVQLSFRTSRADYPVIAASGDDAWVVWTNAGSGLIRMASTTDAGHHWTATSIGTTTSGAGSAEGYRGLPSIGASGSNVVTIWFATPGGRQVALTSDMGGTDWSTSSTPVTLVGSSPNSWLRYPAARGAEDGRSSNVAIAYLTSTRLVTRVFDGTSLSSVRIVDGPWPRTIGGHRYMAAYGPAVAPSGPHGLTVAWSACRRVAGLRSSCAGRSPKARIDLYDRVSTDEGASWAPREALAIATKARAINEAPSITADEALARTWFAWLGRTASWSTYRVYGRSAA